METITININYRFKNKEERIDLKQKVMSYENEGLLKKFCYENDVNEEVAKVAFTELKKFLFVCGVTKERLSPTFQLDNIWHQFILFTKDYYDFCMNYFGRIIHHIPDTIINSETKQKNKISYIKAYEIALVEFTYLNPYYWVSPDIINQTASCGEDAGTTGCNSECANCGDCSHND